MQGRKWLGLLCAMMLVILTACGGSGGGDTAKATQSASNNEDSPSPVASEPEEQQEEESSGMEFDLGGRTIKYVSWYDEAIKEDNPDGIAKKQNLDALMEKHNFTIEYVVIDYGEYKDKIAASLIAGEAIGDIVRYVGPWMIPSLTKLDLFTPVDEYTGNEDVFLQQYTNEYSQYNGRGYGFRAGINGAAQGIWYNRTLMNKLGMTPIQSYVDADNWNWDTFIEVAKQANQDTNNDGKLDTWGLATDSLLKPALASNDADLVLVDQQGLDDPKTVETLNFLSRMATEKVGRPTEGGDWTEPKTFFLQGNTLMYFGADYESGDLRTNLADYDLGFLPFPKGPSASDYQGFVSIPNYLTIPSTVENPEQIVYIFEKMNEIESIYDYPHQLSFETNFMTEEDIENAKKMVRSIKAVGGIDGYPSMPYYEFSDEIRQGISVSTIIEKYKAPFQSSIDEVWKK